MKKFAVIAVAASMFVLAACDNTPSTAPAPGTGPGTANPKTQDNVDECPRADGEECK